MNPVFALFTATLVVAGAYAPPAEAMSGMMWRSGSAGCMLQEDPNGDGMCMADGTMVFFDSVMVCD